MWNYKNDSPPAFKKDSVLSASLYGNQVYLQTMFSAEFGGVTVEVLLPQIKRSSPDCVLFCRRADVVFDFVMGTLKNN